ncbi:MAG: VWA domain-containing protein [Planctomycetota bacterium]
MSSLRPSAGLAAALLVVAALPYAAFHGLTGAELRAPWGLAAGGLALPLILLHMLKVQLPRKLVGSLLLWQRAVPSPSGARPLQALRRNLPLLLQLLALGALTYALAGPVVGGFGGRSTTLLLILDVSASMGAVDEPGGATRLERAREQALALLAGLEAGGEASLIAVDHTATVLCPWTGEEDRLRAALEGLSPRAASTDLAQANRHASAQARGRQPEVHAQRRRGRPPGDVPLPWDPALPPRDDPPNLGIVAAELQALGPQDEATHEVYARVLNTGPPRQVFLGVTSGDALLAARAIQLGAGEARAATVRLTPPPGVLELRLLADARATPITDGLAADDRAWLQVLAPRPVTYALTSDAPRPHLTRGLRAAGASPTEDATSELWVGVGVAPSPGTDALCFAPPGPVGPVTPGAALRRPEVVAWDREHPLLAHVEPRQSCARARPGPRARPRRRPPGLRRLVLAALKPCLWSRRSATALVLQVVVGFDPEDSSWPRRPPPGVPPAQRRAPNRATLAGGAAGSGAGGALVGSWRGPRGEPRDPAGERRRAPPGRQDGQPRRVRLGRPGVGVFRAWRPTPSSARCA